MLAQLQVLHFYVFVLFFILFATLEYFFPLRKKIGSTIQRWKHNFGMAGINASLKIILFFVMPVFIGMIVAKYNIGFFNWVEMYWLIECILTIILFDFFIYFQHQFSHKWKWFWKIHSIHHSDKNLDVSTALRFHVIEIAISLLFKSFLVVIFGFNPIFIVIFEMILLVSAMFNHSNLHIPKKVDYYVSIIFVTPGFHQVHHSVIHKQTDSNYGFFLSIWDRIFHTYTSHQFMVKKIGLSENKNNLTFKDLFLLKINK